MTHDDDSRPELDQIRPRIELYVAEAKALVDDLPRLREFLGVVGEQAVDSRVVSDALSEKLRAAIGRRVVEVYAHSTRLYDIGVEEGRQGFVQKPAISLLSYHS